MPISGFTGSQEAFRQISKWLEECFIKHKYMCPSTLSRDGPPTLPFRVLEIPPSESQGVRLLETRGQTGYWACISHCWGGQQPLVTTREPDTLSQHQKGIPWEDLPKTFQEAIVVTRAIGIPYLWIDSLCIVQDDPYDWQVQSAQMAEIYHKSILTIAGSISPGPNQGIFRHAGPIYMDSPISDIWEDGRLGKVRTRKSLPHIATELPLLGRGWVHQERLLSPRVIHFAQNELIWECMERLTCECRGVIHSDMFQYAWPAPKARFHPWGLNTTLNHWNGGLSVWHDVVSDYSHMALSRSEDIFPAISGLAKSVGKTTGWKYAAGLWQDNLILDLVWRTVQPHGTSRCLPWRAPTFSWASVISSTHRQDKGLISYDYMNILKQGLEGRTNHRRITHLYANVVETSCTPITDGDVTGRLKSGYVILRGTLTKATLCRLAAQDKWHVMAIGKEPDPESRFSMDFDLNACRHFESDRSEEVFCLKLAGVKQIVTWDDQEFLLHLVLKEVYETSNSLKAVDARTFERIGILVNDRGDAHIEDVSDASAVSTDTLVKIM
jgi:hypothetical protein